ncbi:hypothetical protein ACIA8I_33440 [Streptomyces rishiriensis]|uniref:hypothetical protein n=1 Tax=Streptomyces rishiriensis TaxID=68264 RepID=UPI000D59EFA3|nr:hypothetical protein [Streptomyces rishiriensis]
MGTKTADETGAETAGTTTDDEKTDVTGTDAADEVTEEAPHSEEDADELAAGDEAVVADGSVGVGQGAGAVVSAVLGFVSLTGSWIGTLAGARQTLVGQLQTSASSGTTVAKQLEVIYGDAWQATALWAGLFALAALVTGVVVLARPAFGNPARPQAAWIKSVSWAGVALGVVGLLLAVLKYTDALLGLPSAG